MSLDIYLESHESVPCAECKGTGKRTRWVTEWFNITHNLTKLWSEIGIYEALYNSDGKRVQEVLPALKEGLGKLEADPTLSRFDAPNGWGTYENAVPWLRKVVEAFADAHPESIVRVDK